LFPILRTALFDAVHSGGRTAHKRGSRIDQTKPSAERLPLLTTNHAGNLLLHPLTGKTGRIILYRKIKHKREFVIGGLGDWWILSHAETQRVRERRGYFGVVTSLKE